MELEFKEALIELKEGRCDKIRSLFSGHAFILFDGGIVAESGRRLGIKEMLEEWVLVDPKPQMEEVEESRWAAYTPETGWIDSDLYKTKEMAESTGHKAVEVKFPITRPIPRKVKRKERVKEITFGLQSFKPPFDYKGNKVELYAEWEDII